MGNGSTAYLDELECLSRDKMKWKTLQYKGRTMYKNTNIYMIRKSYCPLYYIRKSKDSMWVSIQWKINKFATPNTANTASDKARNTLWIILVVNVTLISGSSTETSSVRYIRWICDNRKVPGVCCLTYLIENKTNKRRHSATKQRTPNNSPNKRLIQCAATPSNIRKYID